MASVKKVETKSGEVRWVVCYRDPSRRSREKWFKRKADAESYRASVVAEINKGNWLDPRRCTSHSGGVGRNLKKLERVGLVIQRGFPARWAARHRDPALVAQDLGTAGSREDQRRQHGRERDAFYLWHLMMEEKNTW